MISNLPLMGALMRIVILILLLVSLLLTMNDDWTLQIHLVIPRIFIPYYDWLINFPGYQDVPETPETPENLTDFGFFFETCDLTLDQQVLNLSN